MPPGARRSLPDQPQSLQRTRNPMLLLLCHIALTPVVPSTTPLGALPRFCAPVRCPPWACRLAQDAHDKTSRMCLHVLRLHAPCAPMCQYAAHRWACRLARGTEASLDATRGPEVRPHVAFGMLAGSWCTPPTLTLQFLVSLACLCLSNGSSPTYPGASASQFDSTLQDVACISNEYHIFRCSG